MPACLPIFWTMNTKFQTIFVFSVLPSFRTLTCKGSARNINTFHINTPLCWLQLSIWVCIIFTSLLPLNWSQEEEVINIYSLSPLTTSQGPSEVCNADIKVSGLVLKTKASDFKGKRVVVGKKVSFLDPICPPGPYSVTYKQHGTAITRLPLGSWMTCPPVPFYSTGFASKWFMISAL